jgi:Sec-independent protein translocase protein TatA
MEILGVGASEFVFILILALIILGPKDMQKAGKTIGKWLRSIVTSDGWKIFQQTSRELKTLPNRLMREANEELGDVGKELNNTVGMINGRPQRPFTSPNPQPTPVVLPTPENKIEPPAQTETKANESDSKADA